MKALGPRHSCRRLRLAKRPLHRASRGMAAALAAVLVALLGGCGGVDEPAGTQVTPAPAAGRAAPASDPTATQLWSWVESNLGHWFPGPEPTQTAPPFDYRWYGDTGNGLGVQADGSVWIIGPVAGQTTAPVQVGYLADYACAVLDLACAAPFFRITEGPQAQTVFVGSSARFNVAVSGAADARVQWQRRSSPRDWRDIDGASGPTLSLVGVMPADDGTRVRAVVRSGTDLRTSSAATLTVLPLPPDLTPPTILSLRVGEISDRDALVSWRTDEPATSSVTYRSGTGEPRRVDDPQLRLDHAVRLPGLQADTSYVLSAGSRDAAGNAAAELRLSFRTLVPPPGVGVAGNRLVDERGAPIVVRGVNRSGTEYMCAQGRGIFDPPGADAQTLLSMLGSTLWASTNALRIPLNQSCWLGHASVPAAYAGVHYQAAIRDLVDRATARGLIVILELHWSAPGEQLALGQQPMADRDHSPEFWRQVALAFGSNARVLLDLFNEPAPDGNLDSAPAWACWRWGGVCPGVPFVAAGMQELVDAVRGTGARNVLVLSGVQYGNALSRWLDYRPADPLGRLVAGWHMYGGNACADPGCWAFGAPALVRAAVPLIVTEFGSHHDAAQCRGLDLVQDFMRWAERSNVGTLAWTLNAWGNCHALIADETGRATDWGRAVQSHSFQRDLVDESQLAPMVFVELPAMDVLPLAFPVRWVADRSAPGESWEVRVALDKGVNACDGSIEESFVTAPGARCLDLRLSASRYHQQSADLAVIAVSNLGRRVCTPTRRLRFDSAATPAGSC